MPPVLSLGEVLIDLIAADGATSLEEVSAFAARPGGAPANVAVALARLGVASAFGGVVGADALGRRLRGVLEAEGVDVSRLRETTEAATTIAFGWTDAAGRGTFWLPRAGAADRLLSAADIEAAGLDRVAALCVGSVALVNEPSRTAIGRAVELASVHHVPIVFDVNLRAPLWANLADAKRACEPLLTQATLIKLSIDDAGYLGIGGGDPDAILFHLGARFNARLVVLTDGARGAWHASRTAADEPLGPTEHTSAFPVQAVESTGAGDAFTAALITRLIQRNWSPPDAADLRFAAAAGALTTTREGAIAALPTRAEIDAFLTTQGPHTNGT